MDINSVAWTNFWGVDKYPPSNSNYVCDAVFGTPQEPDSSIWCASLLESSRDKLEEPFSVLDYGCGDGRLFNFLSRHFKDFNYYGLETETQHGVNSINLANRYFQNDKRASFGHKCVKADLNVLGSVATHISIKAFENILKEIMPSRLGTVASIFISDNYYLESKGAFGYEDCYARAFYTKSLLDKMCKRLGLNHEQKESFLAQGCNAHLIFHFWNK
jgi:Methionine biosynthesis protein MetW